MGSSGEGGPGRSSHASTSTTHEDPRDARIEIRRDTEARALCL